MRIDFQVIQQWIKPGSHVLDLGCGDGTLLKLLSDTKQVSGYGLEIDAKEIASCVEKGVNVIDYNLDQRHLDEFNDQSFDTVIMTQALQTMRYPDKLVEEMLRIGKECIVTFPNFGHWKARLHLGLSGVMPVSDLLPYEWYNTPNIHFCTFKDFEVLCKERNITIKQRLVVTQNPLDKAGATFLPNLFGDTAIYHLG
ncbi:methionine biosynthesis protein MetW [Marinibactrum halimedae]|uniref:Methionine biosynthesis protein MetW n=1 Tax=Marinibactrum halimedae TaxID=1444977 RepID=A0AA37T526_9GAMM|nr:methionine biosynthesis protein MetW [Marinibactrum halimedae]MCD9458313.1 methionine biosynthesis protein MetW [Marinibactrum halimedae]GLS27060.1 methionine biosynthesis protein MetW [Marinibactrum halimedae]